MQKEVKKKTRENIITRCEQISQDILNHKSLWKEKAGLLFSEATLTIL